MDKLPDLGGAEHDPLSSAKAQKLPEGRGPMWQLKILELKDRSLFCFVFPSKATGLVEGISARW